MRVSTIKDNFPNGFYEELARLIVVFGHIEYMIKLCIKDLCGEGFTNGMAHAESKHQFSELCKEAKRKADTRLCYTRAASFCTLIEQAEKLGDYRNDTVHALWTTDETGQPLRVRPKLHKGSNWRRFTQIP